MTLEVSLAGVLGYSVGVTCNMTNLKAQSGVKVVLGCRRMPWGVFRSTIVLVSRLISFILSAQSGVKAVTPKDCPRVPSRCLGAA